MATAQCPEPGPDRFYVQGAGLPTTQISPVREHTAKITPPRALWVPFELERPLGVPGEAAFQTRVLRSALQREIAQLRTWYDLAVTGRNRTTVGVSRLTPEEMGMSIGVFLDGQTPPNPRADIPLAALFRYAVEDLKAYYCEARAVQPGNRTADSTTLADWFWRETTAGRVGMTLWLDDNRADHPTLIVRIAVEDTVVDEGAGCAERHTLRLAWLQVSRVE